MKHHTSEQIVAALRQAEGGIPAVEVCRRMGITEQTFYRWKRRVQVKEINNWVPPPSRREGVLWLHNRRYAPGASPDCVVGMAPGVRRNTMGTECSRAPCAARCPSSRRSFAGPPTHPRTWPDGPRFTDGGAGGADPSRPYRAPQFVTIPFPGPLARSATFRPFGPGMAMHILTGRATGPW
jgi:hypothetical protein